MRLEKECEYIRSVSREEVRVEKEVERERERERERVEK